jgi:hypothetical protein
VTDETHGGWMPRGVVGTGPTTAEPRYTPCVHRLRERAQAETRVVRLEDDDGALDRAQWLGTSIEERIAAVWELTLECLAWTDPDADEPRLQRSVCRVERRRR